jgi:iron complex outermembrane recepter protein
MLQGSVLSLPLIMLLSLCGAPAGAAPDARLVALKRLSVEELMNMEVYSASRYMESAQTSPSAIFVLTGEDIRRAHVTSIPEALRLVPGMQVAKVDANKWAVSMRGFNSREANKLLVLMDGRSIYDPLFSGMLWEAQDAMLEDIERIEVIRGPGGTLWGANAFNGIINIITRHSSETEGGVLALSRGDEEHYIAAARYGWQPVDNQHARIYLKAYDRDEGYSTVSPPYDASRMLHGGFRWDWTGSRDELRVSGDVSNAHTGIREDPTLVQDVHHQGHNAMVRWNRQFSVSNGLQLQAYYDHVDYGSFGFTQRRATWDLELQQSLQVSPRNFVVWGGGLRLMRDHTQSGLSGFVDVLPLSRHDQIKNVFAQDTIELLPAKLHLIAGLKYESTDYASAEWLPNLRLSYAPDAAQTWWAAVSEATRVPSRLESDLTFFNTIRPGDGFGAEHVRAYELGERQLLSPQLGYDIAVFYNDYSGLRSAEQGGVQFRNLMRGHTYGAEFAVRWQPAARWRLDVAYTWLEMDLGLDPSSNSNPGQPGYIEGLAAHHQTSLHSLFDITQDIDFDATLRYVGSLPSLAFPAYTEIDLSLAWRPRGGLELSLTGQNLLHAHHPEQDFAFSASGMPTEIQRSVYARLAWQF